MAGKINADKTKAKRLVSISGTTVKVGRLSSPNIALASLLKGFCTDFFEAEYVLAILDIYFQSLLRFKPARGAAIGIWPVISDAATGINRHYIYVSNAHIEFFTDFERIWELFRTAHSILNDGSYIGAPAFQDIWAELQRDLSKLVNVEQHISIMADEAMSYVASCIRHVDIPDISEIDQHTERIGQLREKLKDLTEERAKFVERNRGEIEREEKSVVEYTNKSTRIKNTMNTSDRTRNQDSKVQKLYETNYFALKDQCDEYEGKIERLQKDIKLNQERRASIAMALIKTIGSLFGFGGDSKKLDLTGTWLSDDFIIVVEGDQYTISDKRTRRFKTKGRFGRQNSLLVFNDRIIDPTRSKKDEVYWIGGDDNLRWVLQRKKQKETWNGRLICADCSNVCIPVVGLECATRLCGFKFGNHLKNTINDAIKLAGRFPKIADFASIKQVINRYDTLVQRSQKRIKLSQLDNHISNLVKICCKGTNIFVVLTKSSETMFLLFRLNPGVFAVFNSAEIWLLDPAPSTGRGSVFLEFSKEKNCSDYLRDRLPYQDVGDASYEFNIITSQVFISNGHKPSAITDLEMKYIQHQYSPKEEAKHEAKDDQPYQNTRAQKQKKHQNQPKISYDDDQSDEEETKTFKPLLKDNVILKTESKKYRDKTAVVLSLADMKKRFADEFNDGENYDGCIPVRLLHEEDKEFILLKENQMVTKKQLKYEEEQKRRKMERRREKQRKEEERRQKEREEREKFEKGRHQSQARAKRAAEEKEKTEVEFRRREAEKQRRLQQQYRTGLSDFESQRDHAVLSEKRLREQLGQAQKQQSIVMGKLSDIQKNLNMYGSDIEKATRHLKTQNSELRETESKLRDSEHRLRYLRIDFDDELQRLAKEIEGVEQHMTTSNKALSQMESSFGLTAETRSLFLKFFGETRDWCSRDLEGFDNRRAIKELLNRLSRILGGDEDKLYQLLQKHQLGKLHKRFTKNGILSVEDFINCTRSEMETLVIKSKVNEKVRKQVTGKLLKISKLPIEEEEDEITIIRLLNDLALLFLGFHEAHLSVQEYIQSQIDDKKKKHEREISNLR